MNKWLWFPVHLDPSGSILVNGYMIIESSSCHCCQSQYWFCVHWFTVTLAFFPCLCNRSTTGLYVICNVLSHQDLKLYHFLFLRSGLLPFLVLVLTAVSAPYPQVGRTKLGQFAFGYWLSVCFWGPMCIGTHINRVSSKVLIWGGGGGVVHF